MNRIASITSKSLFEEGDGMSSNRSIVLQPIGLVRTSASKDDVRLRSKESEATVEIYPEFQEALEGLEGFSHIFVISYLNQLRPEQIGPLKVKPRRLLLKGFNLEELPLVGVFAIDSPTRPNPIGLSLVKLAKIDGHKLTVRGLDCFDGTPVLDIKPYRPDYRAEDYELADWYKTLRLRVGEDV
jgi:tRNA-Thr(GGU) m(6)t(6)A37 methyltransferase TsaA